MSFLVHVLAIVGITVSAVGVVVMVFRAPSTEMGWGGDGSCTTLPDAIHGLVLLARDRREARKAVTS